ncbi:MAG TPA: UDP-N-acetylmuramoyl-tripeptide--D-alanyl-D-alanine ligase [Planktothrix sp.]
MDAKSYAAEFTAPELASFLSPVQAEGTMGAGRGSISTDTRSIAPGQWYLALKGETFDGHRFVQRAIEGGAAGCIVASLPADVKVPESCLIFAVNDTLAAYHQIAKAYLNKVKPFVIGVTGSSGKTTTKEMCAAVVAARRFHKSAANENNEFGLPKTILSMPPDTEILVVEMAMRGLGQIALLARTAKPDAGIITGVGTAHIELLGSQENIIIAKCEMLEQMENEGLAVIGNPTEPVVARARKVFSGDLALFSDADVAEVAVSLDRTRFTVRGFEGEFEINAHGIRHMQDAWCAIVAGRAAGLSNKEIAEGLATYKSVEGRGNRLKLDNGAVLIDESYNANPDSVKCAVEALLDKRAFPQANKYVVLGEMAELGDSTELLHKQTGQWLRDTKISMLLTVGSKAKIIADAAEGASFAVFACDDQAEALELLKPQLSADSCVMIKGSHCAALDKMVELLKAPKE